MQFFHIKNAWHNQTIHPFHKNNHHFLNRNMNLKIMNERQFGIPYHMN